MSLMDDVRRKAAQDPQRVAFYEGENPKILEVAAELTKGGLARCAIVGDAEAIRAKAREEGVDLAGVELVDVTDEEGNESFSKRFEVIPACPYKSKGVRRHAARAMDRAFMMQRIGDVDVSFGGIDCSTGDVILAGEKIIGLADGVTTVSSAGIFDVPGWEGSEGNLLGFADSAVCVNPDSQKLAQIAVTSARTVAALTGWEPRVAMLSYSTDGSSEGELVQKVRDAVEAAHELAPELKIDGEFQLDAAIRPDVAAKKVHRPSEVAGRANVIVWPDINVGNIGVKLVQNFAHANAYGPFLQGFQEGRVRLLALVPRSRARWQRRYELRPRPGAEGGLDMADVKKRDFRVLVINPGSTSTKVGVFEGERALMEKTVDHDAATLSTFAGVSEQMPYRMETIMSALAEAGIDPRTMDAFVGRGGGLMPVEGGTYEVNDTLLDHARRGANGVQHPAQLGPQIAHELAQAAGRPAFVVNPPDTDELCDLARMTGVRGVYRHVHLHALNLKETAIRHAASMGRRYEELDLVVCHVGGGISVSAHHLGRMVDGYDIVGGEGMMAPTRCGASRGGGAEPDRRGPHHGGAPSHVHEDGRLCGPARHLGRARGPGRAAAGDAAARRAWDALLYQLTKAICAMAGVLGGHVDAILLGGGMAHSAELVDHVRKTCGWVAPVTAYPGEFELEALAAGARRVLSGEERPKTYTGVPVFQGFDD